MENSYGIGVKNRYELLYSDIDPLEILKQQQEEKERRKNEKLLKEKLKAEKGTKQPQATTIKKVPNKEPSLANVTTKNEIPPADTAKPRSKQTADKSKPEEDKEEKQNRRNKEDKPSNIEARDRGDDNRKGKMGVPRGGGGGGGRGKGRGGGGRNNWDNRGKREFSGPTDRFQHSPKEKKESSQNWSAPKEPTEEVQSPVEDPQQELAPPIEQEPAVVIDATETKAPEGEGDAAGLKEEEETALKTMTLDEWKKEQLNQRSVPKFNLRKPGEGEDTTQWKKLYQLKKKDGEAGADEEEEEDLAKKGRQKQVVEIQINFMDSRRRSGRGGRGHRGGGSSRGGSHKYERPQAAPKVDDWNDFPSLITA